MSGETKSKQPMNEEDALALRIAHQRRAQAPAIEASIDPAKDELTVQVEMAKKDGLIMDGFVPLYGLTEKHRENIHKGYVPVRRREDSSTIEVNELTLYQTPKEVKAAEETAAARESRLRLAGVFQDAEQQYPLHGDKPSTRAGKPKAAKQRDQEREAPSDNSAVQPVADL